MTPMATNSLLKTLFSSMLLILIATLSSRAQPIKANFTIKDATVQEIQLAFKQNNLTSRQLVEYYQNQISLLNPTFKGVIEVNPDALNQADKADQERKTNGSVIGGLHGIPILLKDNIATNDSLSTTAGSYALLGSVVPRDAGVVTKLRAAGAIILGKASLSEWSNFRSSNAPDGWSARGGQGKDPYTNGDPCGSSSGSAISVAANLATVSLGTSETDGSILCPSGNNLVVGFKPTVGLTSRAGVIPVTLRQDSVGPIVRTVSDAAYVLDAIVGVDQYDNATIEASKYIPTGGYVQFLKADGLQGKRLGIVREVPNPIHDPTENETFERDLNILRNQGAVLVDNLAITNVMEIYNSSYELTAMKAEFKIALNAYLNDLVTSPVRSLADVIAFNKNNSELEKTDEYGQDLLIAAEATNGIGNAEKDALSNLTRLTTEGFVKLMTENNLDALVTPRSYGSTVLAIGGFPGVIVPSGFDTTGKPFGLCFGGLNGSETKLIEIAYGFEQATCVRPGACPSFEALYYSI